jgi:hypothetical protein
VAHSFALFANEWGALKPIPTEGRPPALFPLPTPATFRPPSLCGTVFEPILNKDAAWSDTHPVEPQRYPRGSSEAGLIFYVAGNHYGTT